MKKFKNSLTAKKWIELIKAVYKGDKYYEKLRKENKKISEIEALTILKTQLKLLKKRIEKYKNITIDTLIQII